VVWLESNAFELIVTIPMVGILAAAFFRLDELVACPRNARRNRRRLSNWDANGTPLCIEPDGTVRNGAGVLQPRPKMPNIRRRTHMDFESDPE
jgi:hypothetical protein